MPAWPGVPIFGSRESREADRLGIAALLVLLLPLARQETYIGAEVCAGCHDKQARWTRGSVHEKAVVPGDPNREQGCETCHGPGGRHLESPATDTIINFRTEEAAVRAERCMQCHPAVRARGHAPSKVACDECHARRSSEAFHSLRAVKEVMKRQQPEVCRRCHPKQHDPSQSRYRYCTGCHSQLHGANRSRLSLK